MEAQEFFYIIASTALILFSGVLLAAIYLAYRLQKFLRHGSERIDSVASHLSNYLSSAGKTWGTLTATSLALKLISRFIRRRT